MSIQDFPENMQEEEVRELGLELVRSTIRSGIINGDLDPKDLSGEQFKSKALEYVSALYEAESSFPLIVADYKGTLLEEARNYLNLNNINLAILIFGTWWEHWLNGIVESRTIKEGLEENDFKDIVRSLNNKAKSSWLLKLLKLPPLDSKHLEVIAKLIERRNQFVHYKYSDRQPSVNENLDSSFFVALESAIEYFISYEEVNIYGLDKAN